ncbi:hypothetical protein COP2_023775 [Malus domestica]
MLITAALSPSRSKMKLGDDTCNDVDFIVDVHRAINGVGGYPQLAAGWVAGIQKRDRRNSSETYYVLLKADQDPSRNYWITTNVVSRNATTPPGLGIFNYYPNHPRRSPPSVPPAGPAWDNVRARLDQSLAYKAHQGFIHAPPATSDRVIVLLNTQNTINGFVRWSVNPPSRQLWLSGPFRPTHSPVDTIFLHPSFL